MRFLARCALVLLLAAVCLPFFGCAAPAAPEPEGEISLTARFQDGGGDALSSGAVIDASTDAAGTSFVTLKPDTASVDLLFALRGDGALACALRL